MTVAVVTPRVVYQGNSAGPSTFAVSDDGSPIVFFNNEEIAVFNMDADGNITQLTEGVHYSLAGGPYAGVVTRSAGPLPTGQQLCILRSMPYVQEADMISQGSYSSEAVEGGLDALARLIQDVAERADRSLKSDVFDAHFDAGSRRIAGLAPAVLLTDAVNYQQLIDAALGDVEFAAPQITISPISDLPGIANVQDALAELAEPDSFPAFSFYARNAAAAGAPTAIRLADIAEDGSPGTGDKLLGFLGDGSIRVFDVSNLPGGSGGGGGLNNVVDDASPQLGGDLDIQSFKLNRLRFERAINISSTNLNNLKTGGFYSGGSLTNSPDGTTETFYVMVQIYDAHVTGSNEYIAQTAWNLAVSNPKSYFRISNGGTWTSWRRLLDSSEAVPVALGGTGAADAATAFANLKQAATTTTTGVVEKAVAGEIYAATADKYISADLLSAAAAGVALADAATVAVNWQAGINFTLTVAASRQIGNPTNGIPGTSRTILVKGNDATDRTISFGNQFGGTLPVITDCDSAKWYLLTLWCVTASHFLATAINASAP